MKLRVGTRGSALALWQADHVADRLRDAWPDLAIERTIYKTTGDAILDRPLAEIGGKGLFTKELEEGLLAGRIDLAVHSMKDMPTALPEGLVIGAVPERADVRDCAVLRAGEGLEGARVVGTASLRRACLARAHWAGLGRIEAIRGNVPTRVGRLHQPPPRRCDVVILAMAGLARLGLLARDDVCFVALEADDWLPAVGQGALAVECRADDTATLQALAALHDPLAARRVEAERAFLAGVEGDCRVPVGALALLSGDEALHLAAFVGHPETGALVRREARGAVEQAAALGAALAVEVLDAGGAAILREVRA